jgi:hypothetical protein
MLTNTDENEVINTKKFEIGCPMEETCADVRIINEYLSKIPLKKETKKYNNSIYSNIYDFYLLGIF